MLWLVVTLLAALGLFLLWEGQRSGDELRFALGGVVLAAVVFLGFFHLIVRVLERRRERQRPPERREPEIFDPLAPLVLTDEIGGPLLLTREVRDDRRFDDDRSDGPGMDPDVGMDV